MTNYDKLISVLEDIFQLNQADLDFGIYRIMNQKREEITRFLHKRLVPQVKEIIASSNLGDSAQIKKDLDEAINQAKALGADPDTLPRVQQLREQLKAAPSPEALENEIFSHLASFFKRYYKDGDFISMRRYKKDVYAIPYEGEEVKLHWANHDQYYIKTSEYLKNYAFKLPNDRLVRFELAEASTEKDNRKEESGKERRFKIFGEKPVEVQGNTLTVFFTYEPTDKKEKQENLNDEAAATVKKHLPPDWMADVLRKMPTDKNKDRTLLNKHIKDFTARNTFDYFIHKDLGGFLTRELDFYIKNEVLHLDDINFAGGTGLSPLEGGRGVNDLSKMLLKIEALRTIGGKITAFLAQLEDFQKKLWLKKKFVVDTQYCITLDRIPDSFYEEIAANDAQWAEWQRLFAIDEIEADLFTPSLGGGPSGRGREGALKSQPHLVLDTAFFPEDFKHRLLATFDDLDEQLDGLLINSENFQALNLLQERYREQVKCVYIDPPYNTGSDGFLYRDSFKHSSWCSLIYDGFLLSRSLLMEGGAKFVSSDDGEIAQLRFLLNQCFGQENFLATVIWEKVYAAKPAAKTFSTSHDYISVFAKDLNKWDRQLLPRSESQDSRYLNPDDDERGAWASDNLLRNEHRDNSVYTIISPTGKKWTPKQGTSWRHPEEEMKKLIETNQIWFGVEGNSMPRRKKFLTEVQDGLVPETLWKYKDVGHTQEAKRIIISLFGYDIFSTPKPTNLISRILQISSIKSDISLDYFAGSGTTGHAVINLNRTDGGRRKYILVEMGQYFDTVTKPRIQKVIYSEDWKDGKPTTRQGSSHAFKYLRLESYEDTLNNLVLRRSASQQSLLGLNERFEEEYLLHYWLDVESEGSLLSTEAFQRPFDYTLNITKDNESVPTRIDLVETFNYLIGLKVKTTERIRGLHVVTGESLNGEQVLVIWRNLTGEDATSNEALDAFFQKQGYNTRDQEFDRIYVNGDNNLENLKTGDEQWKVVLVEEAFLKNMFDVNDI